MPTVISFPRPLKTYSRLNKRTLQHKESDEGKEAGAPAQIRRKRAKFNNKLEPRVSAATTANDVVVASSQAECKDTLKHRQEGHLALFSSSAPATSSALLSSASLRSSPHPEEPVSTPPSSPPPLRPASKPDISSDAESKSTSMKTTGSVARNTDTSAREKTIAVPLETRSSNIPSKAPRPSSTSPSPLSDSLSKRTNTTRSSSTSSSTTRAPKRQKLTQMRIDLGLEVHKSCKVCGMDYVASNEQDAAEHKRYHAVSVGGLELSGLWCDAGGMHKLRNIAWSDGCAERVVVFDKNASFQEKAVARKVLHTVTMELSAVNIEDEELWGQKKLKDYDDVKGVVFKEVDKDKDNGAGAVDVKEVEEEMQHLRKPGRFKMYLYLRERKCVGMCLVERIAKGHRILPAGDTSSRVLSAPSQTPSSGSLTIEERPSPAVMGISRIWTPSSHRRQGIAKKLLDCAAISFMYGMHVDKELIAFSQPTQGGTSLARSWFGKCYGWLVYT